MAHSKIAPVVVITLLTATVVFSQDAQKEPPPPPSPASDSSQSNAPTTGPVRVPGNVASAMLIHQVTPVYPAAAKEQHVEGVVQLHAIIGKDGTLQNLTYLSGPPILMSSAMEAVKQWQYKPTLLSGEPVQVDTTISVVYTLGGKSLTDVPEYAHPQPGSDTSPSDAFSPPPGSTRVAANFAAGYLIHQVAPVYPAIARTAHISGTVVLHALIAKDGTIERLQVVSGPPLLLKSSMDAVQQWVYRPTLVNGEPALVDTTISVVFSLDGKNPNNPGGSGSPSAVPGSSPELPPLSAVEPSQDQQKEQTAPQTPASTSSEPNSSTPKRTREGHVTAATLIYQVTPVYPKDAKKKHIQGTVTLNATIAKDGSVENLVYESGPPMLMASAMEAVKKWRYKPTVLNGEPVAVNTAISVTYTLGNH